MSLVQYDSSPESSDNESSQIRKSLNESVEVPTQSSSSLSITSFLPPPKNPDATNQSNPQILGKNIKNTLSSQIAIGPDAVVLPKSERKITSFVPFSVRNKARTTVSPQIQTPSQPESQENKQARVLPMKLIGEVKSKNRRIGDTESIQIRTMDSDDDDALMQEPESEEEHQSKGTDNIREFDLDSFYSENIELKAKGELRENKRLYSVSNSKNQLSSLVKNAQQNKEILQEKFERNKRARKERESRYGL